MQSIVLELVRESLIAVVNEMRANMIRASYSSVIFEGHDFSCALLTRDGRQIAQGQADHPIHIFAIPASVRQILGRFGGDISPGDIFLHNDPYTGGTHLNDILMVQPIFDEKELVAFVAVRAHWNDVGGMTPGSLSGGVSEIIQEGLRIPPVKIVERGRQNGAALEILFANMRVERERRGDFDCMIGTCRKADEQVRRLCGRFGRAELLSSMDELITRAALRMRSAIAALPDGVYKAEGFIESDGHSLQPLRIKVAITVTDDRLTADFAGTARQVPGPTNAGIAMAANSVLSITKAFLDPGTPINEGSFEPIEVSAPLGTIVNARAPAPCGGMAEVKYAIDSVVAAALGQAVPARRAGDTKGTANHVHITSLVRDGDPKILYEWPAAGTGATAAHDGGNVLRTFAEGDFNSIHSIEVIESSYPLRVIRSEIRTGSCGDGENRGGFGLLREIELRSDLGLLSVLSDRNSLPPSGVRGGRSGAPNRFIVRRGGEWLEPSAIPGKVSGFPLRRGDVVSIRTSGGGGWGNPLDRDPARVAADVEQGYLDAEAVEARYGVVIAAEGVDLAATEALRARLRAAVKPVSVVGSEAIESANGQRSALVSPATAERYGLVNGSVAELFNEASPICRVWIRIELGLEDNEIRVGPSLIPLLKLDQGRALLRPLTPAL